MTDTLTAHFEPKPLVITQRYHFHQRNQGPTESIADYVAALRKLSTHCEFGPQLKDALRDRLVCGVCSEPLQKALFVKNDRTLKTAMEKALSMEAAERNSKDLQGKTATVPMHKIATPQHSSCTAYHKSSSTFWGPIRHILAEPPILQVGNHATDVEKQITQQIAVDTLNQSAITALKWAYCLSLPWEATSKDPYASP